MKYLQLVRFPNLVILALMQLVFRFGFLEKQNIALGLSQLQFLILVMATVCIAAGGYIINDIMDQQIDAINKQKKRIVGVCISEEKAYYAYSICTIIGVSLGMYVSNVIDKASFLSLFMFIAVLLYFYATTLKSILIVGTIVISALLGFSVLILALFDLYPMATCNDFQKTAVVFSILKDYALFAFAVNLIREISKDCEDIIGDKRHDCNTLATTFGNSKTNKIVAVLLLTTAAYLLFYCLNYLMYGNLKYATAYLFITVIAPMLFCFVSVLNAKEKKDYAMISTILKVILLFGIFSIAIITYLIPTSNHG